MKRKKRIAIGIPCYGDPAAEVTWDYMRMMYSFGRRYTDYDFFLIVKTKSEQFRARNAIIDTAKKTGMDYLLFLDDDQIIDWQQLPGSDAYMFLQKLIDADKDIVGAIYFHRTGDFRPVLMKKVKEGYTFLRDDEITGALQRVDVQGGGCMLINMRVFDKVGPPYFEPEMSSSEGQNLGTDIQLCKKAVEAGYEVWCHTGIQLGHLKKEHDVVTPDNRDLYMAEAIQRRTGQEDVLTRKWLKGYVDDALEYMGMKSFADIVEGALEYNDTWMLNWDKYENKDDYYRDAGKLQLCRQVYFHSSDLMNRQSKVIAASLKGSTGQGLDFGCGSAPVGFQLLSMGHHIDFIDIDGAYGYEFLKWRVKKHGFEDRAGWEMSGPYDFVLLLDAIEHIKDWESLLDNIISRMRHKAGMIINFFRNFDTENVEHISMDHEAVQGFLLDRKLYPMNDMIYVKHADVGPMKAVV